MVLGEQWQERHGHSYSSRMAPEANLTQKISKVKKKNVTGPKKEKSCNMLAMSENS